MDGWVVECQTRCEKGGDGRWTMGVRVLGDQLPIAVMLYRASLPLCLNKNANDNGGSRHCSELLASALKNLIALFSLVSFCTHLLDWHRRHSFFSPSRIYALIIDE